MKKTLLTVAAALGLFSAAQAQVKAGVGLRLGLNLGYQTAFVDEDETDNYSTLPKPGLCLGVFGNFQISELFGIMPELLYMGKGAAARVEIPFFPDEDWVFSANYLQLNILPRFRFGGSLKGTAHVGPYFAYWTSKAFYVDGSEEEGSDEFITDDEYEILGLRERRVDVGLSLGLGIEKELGPGALVADLRVDLGFLDTTQYEDGRPDNVDPNINLVMGITAGYRFDFGN